MKVFWPSTGLTCSAGDVVGWKVGHDLCVAAIVRSGYPASPRLVKSCGDITTLGYASLEDAPDTNTEVPALVFRLNTYRVPVSCNIPVQIILFDPPDHIRLRFLTLNGSTFSDTKGNGKAMEDGNIHLGTQDGYGLGCRRKGVTEVEDIIPFINDVVKVQRLLSPKRSNGLFRRLRLDRNEASLGERSDIRLPKIVDTVLRRSSTVQQLSLRSSQICMAPTAFSMALDRKGTKLDERSRRYMKFWNTVWLILNDLILGYCARQVLSQIYSQIEPVLPDAFQNHLVIDVVKVLRWLNDWPVGLKLNTPLSSFFSVSLGRGIQTWGGFVYPLLKLYGGMVTYVTANSGVLGMTLVLAVIQDMFNLVTLHLRVCNLVMSSICQWQLASLSGLWNLFRGKRWNELRGRMDSYAYDVDQLFLGTLLFTVSAFLFPTVLTYTALFAFINAVLRVIGRVLKTIRGGLNAFPLFEILLRVKESSRLPAGITFDLVKVPIDRCMKTKTKTDDGLIPITHVLQIRNAPKSIAEILWP